MPSLNELIDQELKSRYSGKASEKKDLTNVLSSSKPIPKTGDPAIDFMLHLQKEVVGPIVGGVNSATFGVPKLIANKMGGKDFAKEMFPEQSTTGGKALRIGAEAAGLIGGGAGKLALATGKGVAQKLGGGGVAKAVGGMAGGAVAGAAQVNDPTANLQDYVKNQATQALAGGMGGLAVGTLAPTLKALAGMRNIKGPRAVKISNSIRTEFFNVKSEAVKKFGSQLETLTKSKPLARGDLTDFLDDFNSNMQEFTPEAKNIINKTPLIKNMVSNSSTQATVKEIQDAINYLGKKVPKGVGPVKNEILDAINDLKSAQLDAFPEMKSVRAEYKQMIEPFNNVKNYFRFNKLLSAIKSEFGGPEGEEAVKSLLSPETIKRIGGLKDSMNLSSALGEFARNLTIGVSSGIGAGVIFRKLMRGNDD